ncbi:Do family serine endopeptidase [Sphingobium sp. CFD-2]|uniref:Do family serine endopeptidase n=1 Tax=Sphingobium sp. CFD-2 TaxID=2878542 RepID=UPI00214B6D59|nr:Do family serine endopeptidase [Sphingobium sp. CFD-2]
MRHSYTLAAATLLGTSALLALGGSVSQAKAAQEQAAPLASAPHSAWAATGFADLTERLAPAVVNISTRQRVRTPVLNPFAGTPFEDLFGGRRLGPRTREAQSLGSGFIISADGYVVTNNHVISPGGGDAEIKSITVTMPDGAEYPAKLVGQDAASDLAVLKINARAPLPFVKFGDSRTARVGDRIIAIGNPFGLGGTVTSGIISAVYRHTGLGTAYDRYIQTDAAINRGNSGGPMFDMHGQVIGINNAIYSPNGGSVGIGFAIPAEIAAPIVEKLKSGQAIERGYLGVRIQPVGDDLANALGIPERKGAFVQSVEPDNAADEAGVRPGDVIVAVDGKEVTAGQSLSYLIASKNPGERISIALIRDGKRMTVPVTLGLRPGETELGGQSFEPERREGSGASSQEQGESAVREALGISVLPLTPRIARQLGASEKTQGLVIASVDSSSDAAAKGLRRGDIMLSANNQPVMSARDLESRIQEARRASRGALLLRVQRRGQAPGYVPVRLR